MSVFSSSLRIVALAAVVALVSACSPDLVSRDIQTEAPSVDFPDAHDFSLPMM